MVALSKLTVLLVISLISVFAISWSQSAYASGTVSLDKATYVFGQTAHLKVIDGTASGSVIVHISTTSNPAGMDILLTEIAPGAGIFQVDMLLASPAFFPGDTITATYTTSTAIATINGPPVLNYPSPQFAYPGFTKIILGSATDPDSDPISYSWLQLSGPPVVLSSLIGPTVTFIAPPAPATLKFQLTVSDGINLDVVTTIDVNVFNAPILSFDKPTYTVNHESAIISLTDDGANLNPLVIDHASFLLNSTSDIPGILLNMTETGPNTGIFVNNTFVSTGPTSLVNIHANGGDTINARYFPPGVLTFFSSTASVTNANNGKIAFGSNRTINYQIYSMNSDGSGQTNLSNNAVFDYDPNWSPDGTKIAFDSNRTGNNQIYSMNSDGTGQTRLTNDGAFDSYPSWSPDGTKIVFQTNRGGNYQIYSMNSDGSGQTNLSNNPAFDGGPSWSPDGTKIAFTSFRNGNAEIYVMNSDGSGQTRLTNNPAFDDAAKWSPDGTKIAFMSNRDGNNEIYVMNSDGSGQTRLTNNAADDYGPSWGISPNTSSSSVSVEFDQLSYTVNHDAATITVTDPAANLSPTGLDVVIVNLNSTSTPTGFPVILKETGLNTGIFSNGTIAISTSPSAPSVPSIMANGGDSLQVTYAPSGPTIYGATSSVLPDTGIGKLSSITFPIVLDPFVIYAESHGAIRITDTTSWNSNVPTVTAHISSITSPAGIDVTLTRDATNSGSYTSNQITFTSVASAVADQTNLILPIPNVSTPAAVTATYGANHVTADVLLPPTQQAVINPDTTVGLTCAAGNDRDNDGICDSWETSTGLSIPYNGMTFSVGCTHSTFDPVNDPLNANLCPDPQKPDVYVQAAWMDGHRPDTVALGKVVDAFRNAPVTSQFGSTGINLHILIDPLPLPFSETIPIDGSPTGTIGFRQLKSTDLLTASDKVEVSNDPTKFATLDTAKRQIFHYAAFIHNLSDAPGSSGWGEIGGNDFVVSMGSFTGQVGTTNQQSGTFMHELGHNLGLNHGGPSTNTLNCKPQYLSVMNYLYQLRAADGGFLTARPLDYSHAAFTLTEKNLIDSIGIPGADGLTFAFGGIIPASDPPTGVPQPFRQVTVATGGAVDFNGNSVTTETTGYQQNLHYFGIPDCSESVMRGIAGYDDWHSLNFNFRPTSLYADGVYTQTSNQVTNPPLDDGFEHEITAPMVQQIFAKTGVTPDLPSAETLATVSLNDRYSTTENTVLTIPSPGVLANDTTGAGKTLTATLVTPGSGTVSLNPDGSFEYTPLSNTFGTDSFTYVANDGTSNGNTVTVTITINHVPQAPTVSDIATSTTQNTPVDVLLTGTDVDGAFLGINLLNTPSHGTIFTPIPRVDNNSFRVTYTPASGFTGTDSFQYQFCDASSCSNTGTVTITVNSITPPPPPPTIKSEKGSISGDITSLKSTITDKNTLKKLDRASLHVQKSVGNELWNVDGNSLNDKNGRKVFNQEEKAVKILMKITHVQVSDDRNLHDQSDDDTDDQDLDSLTTPAMTSAFTSSVQAIINHLLGIDKTLAQNEINAANAHLADLQSHHASAKTIKKVQQEIDKAVDSMNDAQSDINKGQLHRAMLEYRTAWDHAEQAVKFG